MKNKSKIYTKTKIKEFYIQTYYKKRKKATNYKNYTKKLNIIYKTKDFDISLFKMKNTFRLIVRYLKTHKTFSAFCDFISIVF